MIPHEEIAFIAYHFHWSYREIIEFEHRERKRWCEEISKINQKMNSQHVGNRSAIPLENL